MFGMNGLETMVVLIVTLVIVGVVAVAWADRGKE